MPVGFPKVWGLEFVGSVRIFFNQNSTHENCEKNYKIREKISRNFASEKILKLHKNLELMANEKKFKIGKNLKTMSVKF